jgi:hypothetical protein
MKVKELLVVIKDMDVNEQESRDWLVWNWDNVFEWGDMSIRILLFQ